MCACCDLLVCRLRIFVLAVSAPPSQRTQIRTDLVWYSLTLSAVLVRPLRQDHLPLGLEQMQGNRGPAQKGAACVAASPNDALATFPWCPKSLFFLTRHCMMQFGMYRPLKPPVLMKMSFMQYWPHLLQLFYGMRARQSFSARECSSALFIFLHR